MGAHGRSPGAQNSLSFQCNVGQATLPTPATNMDAASSNAIRWFRWCKAHKATGTKTLCTWPVKAEPGRHDTRGKLASRNSAKSELRR